MAGRQAVVDIPAWLRAAAHFMSVAKIEQRIANIHGVLFLASQLTGKQRHVFMENIARVQEDGITALRHVDAFIHRIIDAFIFLADVA